MPRDISARWTARWWVTSALCVYTGRLGVFAITRKYCHCTQWTFFSSRVEPRRVKECPSITGNFASFWKVSCPDADGVNMISRAYQYFSKGLMAIQLISIDTQDDGTGKVGQTTWPWESKQESSTVVCHYIKALVLILWLLRMPTLNLYMNVHIVRFSQMCFVFRSQL